MVENVDAVANEQPAGPNLAFENLTQQALDLVLADLHERRDASTLIQFITTLADSLREPELSQTRLVITGDLVKSVNDRHGLGDSEYTLDRGAGMVAAKTMPPDAAGFVDVLLPGHSLLPLDDEGDLTARDHRFRHIAAHEAVHASIHHNGDDPFDLHRREDLGYATEAFASMAGQQIEEHLAEYLSSEATSRRVDLTSADVSASIDAWQDTLITQLPAIPKNDPEFIAKGIHVTFGALNVLWVSLAYLAASLRKGDGFDPVPADIAELGGWRQVVAPWWTRYLDLLSAIPMTIDVDIPVTDEVVRELGKHLQTWAKEIGFDFRDAEGHRGYFRITI